MSSRGEYTILAMDSATLERRIELAPYDAAAFVYSHTGYRDTLLAIGAWSVWMGNVSTSITMLDHGPVAHNANLRDNYNSSPSLIPDSYPARWFGSDTGLIGPGSADVAAHADYNVLALQPFWLHVIVQWPQVPTARQVLMTRRSGSTFWELAIDASGNPHFKYSDGTNTVDVTTPVSLADYQTHVLIGVRDATLRVATLWLDYVLVAAAVDTVTGPLPAANPVILCAGGTTVLSTTDNASECIAHAWAFGKSAAIGPSEVGRLALAAAYYPADPIVATVAGVPRGSAFALTLGQVGAGAAGLMLSAQLDYTQAVTCKLVRDWFNTFAIVVPPGTSHFLTLDDTPGVGTQDDDYIETTRTGRHAETFRVEPQEPIVGKIKILRFTVRARYTTGAGATLRAAMQLLPINTISPFEASAQAITGTFADYTFDTYEKYSNSRWTVQDLGQLSFGFEVTNPAQISRFDLQAFAALDESSVDAAAFVRLWVRTTATLPSESDPVGYQGSNFGLGINLVPIYPSSPTTYYVTARVYDTRGRNMQTIGPISLAVVP